MNDATLLERAMELFETKGIQESLDVLAYVFERRAQEAKAMLALGRVPIKDIARVKALAARYDAAAERLTHAAHSLNLVNAR